MKIKVVKKQDLLLLVILILINYILSFPGVTKYILSTALVFILALKYKINFKENIHYFYPSLFYLVFGMFICGLNLNIPGYYLKLAMFLILPYILALLLSSIMHKDMPKLVNYQFYALLFIYVVIKGLNTESQYAFAFGAYLIYFLFDENTSKKNKIFNISVILILLTFFTGKRLVTILSYVFIIGYIVLRKYKKTTNRKLKFATILTALFVYVYIYMVHNGLYDTLISKYHIIVSGREGLNAYFQNYYNISLKFIGHGAGWTYNVIESSWFSNLHNDLLMVYMDIGFYGLFLWIMSFTKWWKNIENHKKKLLLFFIFLYTIGNYMTDNILIYINYWISIYLIFFSIAKSNNQYK